MSTQIKEVKEVKEQKVKLLAKELPKPEPDAEALDNIEYCTCTQYNWPDHLCPYAIDVHDDHETLCNCCPYCEYECAMDI